MIGIMSLEIHNAESQADIDWCKSLMTEYAQWLQDEICLRGFAEEMAGLPGKYAPPGGRLSIANINGEPAGCIAFRKFGEGTAEAKRLWVRPNFRKHGVGVALLHRMLADVKAAGYNRVVLDTLPKMGDALRLYEALGFARIEAYYESALPGVMFFGKDL
jgi:ribosomal protein S18 acetylase RimI-like enzyme